MDCPQERPQSVTPGEVILAGRQEGIVVTCGKGELRIEKVQHEGKRAMDAHAFMLGHHVNKGDVLGKSIA